MELDKEGLPVLCYTACGVVRGRVTLLNPPEVSDAVQVDYGGPPFLHLIDVTLIDSDHRVVLRTRQMAVNRNSIIFAHEDEVAADRARLKTLISSEDYDTASGEAERLLRTNPNDAELLYLSGLVFEGFEGDTRAADCFRRALDLILDAKFRAIVQGHLD